MKLRKTLSNGVEVIASTNPHLHTFCATVRLRAGSAYEKTSENGITHLMEHCVIRSLRGQYEEDLETILTRSGLYLEARTADVRTEFQICGSPGGLALTAELLRKMFRPIRLSARGFHVEKDRVLAEMVYRQTGGCHVEIDEIVRKGSTVGRSPLGTPARVKRFSRNRLNEHLKSLLVPGNVQLCLTGAIDEASMALLLEAAEQIPMYEGAPMPRELPLPTGFGNRGTELHYQVDINYMRWVFDVDPAQCPWAVMDLLREILFGAGDALLYRTMSEDTGLIYAYNWPYVEYRNFGFAELGFHFDPARLMPTMRAFMKAIELLLGGEFDLEGKKQLLRANWEAIQDNTVSLNGRILHHLMLTDSPEPPQWETVTKADVIRCVKALFSSNTEAILHTDPWEQVAENLNQAYGQLIMEAQTIQALLQETGEE